MGAVGQGQGPSAAVPFHPPSGHIELQGHRGIGLDRGLQGQQIVVAGAEAGQPQGEAVAKKDLGEAFPDQGPDPPAH